MNKPGQTKRLSELDGIRGWAALSVLFFHLSGELFGVQYPLFKHPALQAFLNGPLSVYVFFVLSGDALSCCFTRPQGSGLSPKMVIKRYFRLAGPILFSCFCVYLLMKLGLTFNREAAPLVHCSKWLGSFLRFDPSGAHVLRFSLGEVFFSQYPPENTYNPFLWPMGIEWVGSLMVFAFGFVHSKLRAPLLASSLCAAYLLAFGSYFSLFFVGMSFGMLRARGIFDRLRADRLNRLLVLALLGLLLAVRAFLKKLGILMAPPPQIFIASMLVLLCYCSRELFAFVRNGFSRYLGRISFPLYFMHFAVIVSYTSWVIVVGRSRLGPGLAFPLFVIASSAALSLGLAACVERGESLYLKKIDAWVGRALKLPAAPKTVQETAGGVAGKP